MMTPGAPGGLLSAVQPLRGVGRPFSPMLLAPLLVIALVSATALLTPQLQFSRLLDAAPALAAAMFPWPARWSSDCWPC